MITDADRALFADRKTTLADIKAAGWYPYHSSGGGWWFDRPNVGGVPDHFFLPRWVHELEHQAERRGVSETRGQMLGALGLSAVGKGKAVKFSEGT